MGDPETVEQTLDPGAEVKDTPLEAGKVYKLTIQRLKKALLLEIEDAQFHTDSAVLMPDYTGHDDGVLDPDRITGLAVLRATLLHAEGHPKQKLLIAGHTDTTGSQGYNLELSDKRAKNVLHMLKGERDEWVKSSDEKHVNRDVEQIMAWADRVYGWDCDPGKVDDRSTKKTKAAIKSFQESYNVQFKKSIKEDGLMGTQTWGAVYDVYEKALAELLLETDLAGLTSKRGKLQFLDPSSVGCGEFHPIEGKGKDSYRSKTNRRVELLFFDPGEEPDLKGTCHGGSCNPDKCKLYDDAFYDRRHMGVAAIPGKMVGITLSIIDELGDPLADTEVTLNFDNGAQSKLKTNAKGKIQVGLTEGVDFTLEVPDAQEVVAGHGVTTPSGKHLPPAAESP